MRRDHAPAFGEARPGLHLAADLAGHGVAVEQGRCDRDVAAVSRDDRVRKRAGEARRRAGGAEHFDLRVAEQVLSPAEPDRARVVVELASSAATSLDTSARS
jgi:hypothetical protein